MRPSEIFEMIITAVIGAGLIVLGFLLPGILHINAIFTFLKTHGLDINKFSLLFYALMAVGAVMIFLAVSGLVTFITLKKRDNSKIA